MAKLDVARNAIEMFAITLDALDVIDEHTKVAGHAASSALDVIRAIISRSREGFDGKTTPEIIGSELQQLHSMLGTNDARAFEALANKFKGHVPLKKDPA